MCPDQTCLPCIYAKEHFLFTIVTQLISNHRIQTLVKVSPEPILLSKSTTYFVVYQMRYQRPSLFDLQVETNVTVLYNNNNNNSNFFCANILENQAQWRDKTRGLINLIIESNA